jgi:hypothetical protein
MIEHAPAIFDPPVPLPKLDSWHWRRRFKCPGDGCESSRRQAGQRGRRVLGWHQIGKQIRPGGARMGPDGRVEPGAPFIPEAVCFIVERVWPAHGLTALPDLPDGTLSFGLPEGARDGSGIASRSRATPVLSSAGPTLFGGSGNPYQATRHTPARRRGGMGYWVIGLTYPKTGRPFVVTCPDCQHRCFVDSALPEDELRRLDTPTA